MLPNEDFSPDWISSPGDTISDILERNGLSEGDLSKELDASAAFIKDLLDGHASITISTARALEKYLGGSVSFWMSRDFQYREHASNISEEEHRWLSDLPVGDMRRFGWIGSAVSPRVDLDTCLQFFGTRTLRDWNEKYSILQKQIAFRTSNSFRSELPAVAAWLRRGELESSAQNLKDWDADKFRSVLQEVRGLSREKDPPRFLRRLQHYCSECGVAVVIVRAPSGCRASGVARIHPDGHRLIQLSFRHLSDDHFWFSFFHEAAHLLLHYSDRMILDFEDAIDDKKEREANKLAGQILIPEEREEELVRLKKDTKAILKFARKLNISPGIVVGQLQHRNLVKHSHFNSLKKRFHWESGDLG